MRKCFRFSRIVSMENYTLGRKMLSLGIFLSSLTRAHEFPLTSHYDVEMYEKQTAKLEKKEKPVFIRFSFSLAAEVLSCLATYVPFPPITLLYSILFKLL